MTTTALVGNEEAYLKKKKNVTGLKLFIKRLYAKLIMADEFNISKKMRIQQCVTRFTNFMTKSKFLIKCDVFCIY